jgi:hypothetical protein
MPLPQLVKDIADWTSAPPPQHDPAKAHVLLGALNSPQDNPIVRTLYRGCLYHGLSPSGHHHLHGTMILTRHTDRAGDWAHLDLAIGDDGAMFAGVRFIGSFDDIEPSETIGVPDGAPHGFEDVAITRHFNSSVDHFIMQMDNGWFLAYAKRTATP